jgi:hypothetical protein
MRALGARPERYRQANTLSGPVRLFYAAGYTKRRLQRHIRRWSFNQDRGQRWEALQPTSQRAVGAIERGGETRQVCNMRSGGSEQGA